MACSFKHSFIGYDQLSVVNELSLMDQEFAQKRAELLRGLIRYGTMLGWGKEGEALVKD